MQFTPAGALSGLSGVINAFLQVSASSPDWLLSPPTTSDPLGFGAAGRALSGTATTLGTVAPSNGVLTEDVKFVISQGGIEAVGFVRASDTTGFTTSAQYQSALQSAMNAALARLLSAGGTAASITVAIDGTGNVALTGSTGVKVRGNLLAINFTGPDVSSILDRFKEIPDVHRRDPGPAGADRLPARDAGHRRRGRRDRIRPRHEAPAHRPERVRARRPRSLTQ